ncbi:MAG: hypothetical protein DMG09_18885 [Acidobacteria bacterium]|nr:MAG: hypothetical protein DMG09_18885 [Acidobacteriota bacterium]
MTLASFPVDHIIGKSAGGATEFENLCLFTLPRKPRLSAGSD